MRLAKSSRSWLWRRILCGPYLQCRAWSRWILSGWLHVLLVVDLWQLTGCVMNGLSSRMRAAVANSWLVSGLMSWMGAWSQAPAPTPLVEWWTAIALVSRLLVYAVVCKSRTRAVSFFCWCFGVVSSGVISVRSDQRVESMLLAADCSCALVFGSCSSRISQYRQFVRLVLSRKALHR